jgi:hypothetical protein
MPGMRLTREQVQRLSGVDGAVCRLVLQDLVQAKFLDVDAGGSYARRTDTASSRSRMETAALDVP